MKKLIESLVLVVFIIVCLLVTLAALPFIILYSPFSHLIRVKFLKEYADFLQQNNGKNFFCYNNREALKDFIESEIVPELNNAIEIIYLNGKHVEVDESSKKFISHALYNLRNYSKFPHVMKIREGLVIDKLVNSLTYGIKNQNKSKENFFQQINVFFEIDN